MRTKSGIMLGLGETREEVIQTLKDLKDSQVDVITIGQYLQPTRKHLPVVRFVHPDEFAEYKEIGYEVGIRLCGKRTAWYVLHTTAKHVIPGWGVTSGEEKPITDLTDPATL